MNLTPRARSRLSLDEGQEIRVDDIRMRGGHPVRQAVIGLEYAVLQKLGGLERRVGHRHDLVIRAVHDQDRHVDPLQVFREIGFREGLDVVVTFRMSSIQLNATSSL